MSARYLLFSIPAARRPTLLISRISIRQAPVPYTQNPVTAQTYREGACQPSRTRIAIYVGALGTSAIGEILDANKPGIR